MISLPHRTLIELPPDELVRVAAETGFDAVGFPLIPVRDDEPAWRMLEHPAVLDTVLDALAEHRVGVLDIELVRIEPQMQVSAYRRMFEAGRRLGARFVVAIAFDDDESRVAAHLAELCAEAAPYGLRIALEFMDRCGIRTLAAARRIVEASGEAAALLIDSGHFYRSGAVAHELTGVDAARLPYMQINDVDRRVEPWTKVVPGDGDLPLAELLRALPAGIPISLEVAGPAPAKRDPERYARRACAATRAVASPGRR